MVIARCARLALLILAPVGGCGLGRQGPLATPNKHHVIVLPGINGGPRLETRMLADRINDRPAMSAEVWDWRPDGVLIADIGDVEQNRACSRLFVHRLTTWRAQHDNRDLSLIAISGGAGIVLEACSLLPDQFRFQRIILVAAAVDPDRDLTPALSRVRDGLYAYSSKADSLILSVGTSLFGTMEGVRTASAGYGGFRVPPSPLARQRFFEGRWSPGLVFTDANFGSHHSGMSPMFVARHILPLFDPDGPKRSSIWKRPSLDGEVPD